MPRHLPRDTRTCLARALGHACRLTRRYVSGEHPHAEPGKRLER